MTNETQEQGREREIDPVYGQPTGSRRLKIEKLHYKLSKKYHLLCMGIHKKYEGSFKTINKKCEGLGPWDTLRCLAREGYFRVWGVVEDELKVLRESPLGRIVGRAFNTPREIFDTSNHENMLDASDSVFRNDSDPVLSTILNEGVYKLNVPGNTKRERKKARHRTDIYRRHLQKHVYEHYLSEAVGRPITIEEYEKEFGFLSS